MEITIGNDTRFAVVPFTVDVDPFSVDSMSKRERKEGVVRPGVTNSFYVPGVPSELRIKDFNTGATIEEGIDPRRHQMGSQRFGEHGEYVLHWRISKFETVTTKLSGLWSYRSFRNPTDVSRPGPQKAQPAAHELILQEADFNLERAFGLDVIALQGAIEWEGGGLNLQGTAERESFDIRGTGRPDTPTADWEYDYRGHLIPGWPKPPDVNAADQRPTLVAAFSVQSPMEQHRLATLLPL
jgi:hypothetical protein